MDPLGGGHVDLDAVAKAEEPLGAPAEPHERVKRREDRPRLDAPRPARGGPQVRRGAPPRHLHLDELAGGGQLGHPSLGVRAGQAEVVAQVGLGGDSERRRGDPDEPALGLGRIRRRRREDLGGQDPLGQVVEALEVDPPRGHHLAGEEQVLERDLAVVPVPHVAGPRLGSRDPGRARADGALLGDEVHRVGDELGALADDATDRPPRLGVDAGHPPAKQRVALHRDERGLVGPVLDQAPRRPGRVVAGDAVQQRAVIWPQAREHRHVVGAAEDVDRVELEDPEPGHQLPDLARPRWRGRPRAPEALGGQRDPPRGGGAQSLRGAGHPGTVPDAAAGFGPRG